MSKPLPEPFDKKKVVAENRDKAKASVDGLKVAVAEKAPVLGGATSWSGGWMWAPLNPLSQADGIVDVRFNWFTLAHRYQDTQSFFGTSFYKIDTTGDQPLIVNKKIVLKNDYIRQVIDVYHV